MISIKRHKNRDLLPYTVNRPLTRVELHVHSLGALRHETIWKFTKKKNLKLPGRGTLRELTDYLVVKKGVSLQDFISRFDIIVDAVKGDLKAISQIAYEIVEDVSRQGIVYFELRFSPHLFIPSDVEVDQRTNWLWKVTDALVDGLARGQTDFRTKGNLIATGLRNNPPSSFEETIELVADKNFHGGRIVGVDIAAAGDYFGISDSAAESSLDAEPAVKFCHDAAKLRIPRTVHAGESGSAQSVAIAVDSLLANRIGHGYRIVDDRLIYERIKKEKVHLETCPWSSLLTGAVSPNETPHPIVQFFNDDFNVSINTDDPTVTGTLIDDEFRLLHSWGLSEAHFVKASFNAARSAFLPENEKADLLQGLARDFGCSF